MCQQKEELLRSYTDALNILLGHLRLQADAILAREGNYDRFDGAISAAEASKQEGAEAYREHVARHGCGCAFNLALDVAHNCANGVHIRRAEIGTSGDRAALVAGVGDERTHVLPENRA
jgi:hypothetical protein